VIVSDDLMMGAIVKHYGLEEAAAKALGAGVDVLLISGNTPKAHVYGAERVVLAINRAVTTGLLSRKRVLDAIAHVDTLRARLPR
jgi:beta-N-acetylhexosaminidase